MSDSNCDGSVPLSTDRPRALRIERAIMMHANKKPDSDDDKDDGAEEAEDDDRSGD